MNREAIQREIVRLNEEINSLISSTELPKLNIRPFPLGTWLIAMVCFAWWLFGSLVPRAEIYHEKTAYWAWIAGVVMLVMAFLSTISWFVRGRGYSGQSKEYMEASRRARELQERRRELQMDLQELSKDH